MLGALENMEDRALFNKLLDHYKVGGKCCVYSCFLYPHTDRPQGNIFINKPHLISTQSKKYLKWMPLGKLRPSSFI